MTIQTLVSNFAHQIESIVRADVDARVRAMLVGALGKRGPGRPPGALGKRGPGRPRKNGASFTAKPAMKKPVSAARAKTMKAQGIYLGTIRHLTGADRAAVKAVAKEKGVVAAVAFAKKFKK